jgi:hypothetical protein
MFMTAATEAAVTCCAVRRFPFDKTVGKPETGRLTMTGSAAHNANSANDVFIKDEATNFASREGCAASTGIHFVGMWIKQLFLANAWQRQSNAAAETLLSNFHSFFSKSSFKRAHGVCFKGLAEHVVEFRMNETLRNRCHEHEVLAVSGNFTQKKAVSSSTGQWISMSM